MGRICYSFRRVRHICLLEGQSAILSEFDAFKASKAPYLESNRLIFFDLEIYWRVRQGDITLSSEVGVTCCAQREILSASLLSPPFCLVFGKTE